MYRDFGVSNSYLNSHNRFERTTEFVTRCCGVPTSFGRLLAFDLSRRTPARVGCEFRKPTSFPLVRFGSCSPAPVARRQAWKVLNFDCYCSLKSDGRAVRTEAINLTARVVRKSRTGERVVKLWRVKSIWAQNSRDGRVFIFPQTFSSAAWSCTVSERDRKVQNFRCAIRQNV